MVHTFTEGVPCPTPEQLLTAFGFSLFPVADKKPTGTWTPYQTARAPKETMKRWRESCSDFGIATGPISGVVVVDTDTPEAEAWAEANLPPTPWVVFTGIKDRRTGFRGVHRYYRYPVTGDIGNRASIETDTLTRRVVDGKRVGTGLDVRGQGGYVVAPGSSHPSGVRYEVSNEWEPADKSLLPVYDPAWFDAPARAEKKAPAVSREAVRAGDSAYERAQNWLSKKERPYEGERNHVCYSAACSLFDFGLSMSEVLGLMEPWNRSFANPLDDRELAQTIESAEKTRQAPQYPKGTKVGTRGADPKEPTEKPREKEGDDEERLSQFDRLVEVCEAAFPFFHHEGTAYLSPGESLAVSLDSRKAEQFIRHRFYKETGIAASSENVSKFIGIKAAELAIEGPNCPVFRRVGKLGDKHFLDLCKDGKVIEMTADGWKVVEEPEGVYFIRSGGEEEALPMPEPGGNVLALSEVVNVSSDMLKLLLAYLVCSLRTGFPFVVLVLEGEAGSGKSTLARVLKYLVDPAKDLLRTFPAQERDFAVYAHNSHFLTLDNVDRITAGQSDMLCRASTGGAFSARTHYSMTDETVIGIQRPVVLTGIQGLVDRADMADRVALVQMERVEESSRIAEADLWPQVDKVRPQVLGGILDAFCAGLKNIPKTKLDRLPRMADFAKFATAVEAGLPWEQGEALAAYLACRLGLVDQALEKDVVATAILEFMEQRHLLGRGPWEGTASELLSVLTPPPGIEDRWPRKSSKLGIRLTKAAPLLREKGLSIEKVRTKTQRGLRLKFSPSNPSPPSHLSPGGAKPYKSSLGKVTGLRANLSSSVTQPVTRSKKVTDVTEEVTDPSPNLSPAKPLQSLALEAVGDGVTEVTGSKGRVCTAGLSPGDEDRSILHTEVISELPAGWDGGLI